MLGMFAAIGKKVNKFYCQVNTKVNLVLDERHEVHASDLRERQIFTNFSYYRV